MIQHQLHVFAVDGVLYELVQEQDTKTRKTYLYDERGAKTECDSQLHQIREAITKLQGIGAGIDAAHGDGS